MYVKKMDWMSNEQVVVGHDILLFIVSGVLRHIRYTRTEIGQIETETYYQAQ